MRIMYVEDNQVNLALVERIARMGGHQIISYGNGEEALKALETDKCELILMDIELEGALDGVEVVKLLRERGDNRPIIAVTAYAMVGDMERILEAGCNEYLPKPIPIAQFITLLAKYDPANVQPAVSANDKTESQGTPIAATTPPFTTDPALVSSEPNTKAAPSIPVTEATSTSATPVESPVIEAALSTPDKSETKTDAVLTPASSVTPEPSKAEPDSSSMDETIPAKPEGAIHAKNESAVVEPPVEVNPTDAESKVAAEAKLPNGPKEKDNDGR